MGDREKGLLRKGSAGRRSVMAVAATAFALLAGQAAYGVSVAIDDVTLVSKGTAFWDAETNLTPCPGSDSGFVPVEDGGINFTDGSTDQSDAFDNGLALLVGTSTSLAAATAFDDNDGTGSLSGNYTLSVGPTGVQGLSVSRTERGLATQPPLRSLIRLKNNSSTAKTRDIFWDGDLGSNGSTNVRDSSSGDENLTTADRWVVTSDSATTPSDPVLTHVLFGKRASEKVVEVINDADNGNECLSVRFRVRVPGNSTRYLLFFTEQSETNGQASSRATKYNDRNLSGSLLDGVPSSVRNKVVNWDLA